MKSQLLCDFETQIHDLKLKLHVLPNQWHYLYIQCHHVEIRRLDCVLTLNPVMEIGFWNS